MNNLMSSLGLDKVSGNPNEIDDNTYDGIVEKDELVYVPKSNSINHVVTFKVTEGKFAGKSAASFNKLGINPVGEDGSPVTKPSEVASITHTMSDQNKNFYKALLIALGVPASIIDSGQFVVGSLKDTPVTFTLKTKDGYQNVYNVKTRVPQATQQPGSLAGQAREHVAQNVPSTTPVDTSNLV